MKIIQQINFNGYGELNDSADYVLQENRFYFDPSLFTGIQAIYFQINGKVTLAGTEGDVQLYDITNGVELDTYHFNTTSFVRYRSTDLKSALNDGNERVLGLRVRRTAGGGYAEVMSGSLIIVQEDSNVNRKTASYYNSQSYIEGYGPDYWSQDLSYKIKIRLNDSDGIVVTRFELFGKSTAGGTAQFRLYDQTVGAEVAGSLLQTTATEFTHLVSGDLSLDSTHEYLVQTRNLTSDKYSSGRSTFVVVIVQGFNKVVANVVSFQAAEEFNGEGWCDARPYEYFNRSLIEADSLSFKLDWNFYVYSFGEEWNQTVRLYDKTSEVAMEGTEHTESGTGILLEFYEDIPTVPEGDSEVVFQTFVNNYGRCGPGWLVALLVENLPAGPYISADPAQPSGYHCFMSQFIRNMLAGYIPLRTPDGVNRCW